MSTIEHWKPVVGYEGLYEVSNLGRVRSIDRILSDGRKWKGRELKRFKNDKGYERVNLNRDGKHEARRVHRLVAAAFIGEIPEGFVVAHNDGYPDFNAVWNLRICTPSENERDKVRHGTSQRHMVENGTHNQTIKTHCKRNHPLQEPNLVPSMLKQGRSCLSCQRTHSRVYLHPELKPDFQAISDQYYAALMATKEK